jgi:hypothetical protein
LLDSPEPRRVSYIPSPDAPIITDAGMFFWERPLEEQVERLRKTIVYLLRVNNELRHAARKDGNEQQN